MQSANNLSLKQRWETFQQENPGARIYDASKNLNVSEEELLVIDPKSEVTPLTANYAKFFATLDKFGKLMALTRNQSCVIETYGIYKDVRFFGVMGMALNDGIDLRMFLNNWGHCYAVETKAKDRVRKSFQFFNKFGEAIHKIYLTSSNQDKYFNQIKETLFENRDPLHLDIEAKAEPTPANQDTDLEGLEQDWASLKDTHDFHTMLKKHKISRIDAMHAMEGRFTQQMNPEDVSLLLQELAKADIQFMCFVGNLEMIQIFTGEANTFKKLGSWLNFLDPNFNLHLNSADIHKVFIVKKPSVDGNITSVELYDAKGGLICQFFGARKPGQGELPMWRDIVSKIKA